MQVLPVLLDLLRAGLKSVCPAWVEGALTRTLKTAMASVIL